MVRSIGADHVIDYTREDFTRNGQHYDLVIDAVGDRSISDYRRALSPQGICVVIGFSTMSRLLPVILRGPWVSRTGSQKIGLLSARVDRKDLLQLKELLEAPKVVPVIDRCYPLSKVAEAMRYFGVEHARGKVAITVDHNSHNS
jgi:NADPH:quinone reductase-like Zn-dependent oxidoreductase